MNNIKNIYFDVARNHAKEQEFIVLYKIDNKYHACSICGKSSSISPIHLGEYHHLVQIPTTWILLSYNWEFEIGNQKIANLIWQFINKL